jgi:hypothetical protein
MEGNKINLRGILFTKGLRKLKMHIKRQLLNTCLKEEIAKKHELLHKRRKQDFQLLK